MLLWNQKLIWTISAWISLGTPRETREQVTWKKLPMVSWKWRAGGCNWHQEKDWTRTNWRLSRVIWFILWGFKPSTLVSSSGVQFLLHSISKYELIGNLPGIIRSWDLKCRRFNRANFWTLSARIYLNIQRETREQSNAKKKFRWSVERSGRAGVGFNWHQEKFWITVTRGYGCSVRSSTIIILSSPGVKTFYHPY